MEGIIIKGIGGFYYVKVGERIIECKARGKFRYEELVPTVGDLVNIEVKNDKGFILSINERRNKLIRPSVSNVTQAFVVFALKKPDINIDLLNKFLVLCEYNNIKAIVCLNKLDLCDDKDVKKINDMLKLSCYETIMLKAKEGYGIENIKERIKGEISVFCGPSGVGKSTILNKVAGIKLMETGDISEKLERGKHTTRHSELVEINDGYVVDTPGFSSMDIDFIEKEKLQLCLREFDEYRDKCRFKGCLHYKEPQCSVKDAVKEGKINQIRYEFYLKTLEELLRRNKR